MYDYADRVFCYSTIQRQCCACQLPCWCGKTPLSAFPNTPPMHLLQLSLPLQLQPRIRRQFRLHWSDGLYCKAQAETIAFWVVRLFKHYGTCTYLALEYHVPTGAIILASGNNDCNITSSTCLHSQCDLQQIEEIDTTCPRLQLSSKLPAAM